MVLGTDQRSKSSAPALAEARDLHGGENRTDASPSGISDGDLRGLVPIPYAAPSQGARTRDMAIRQASSASHGSGRPSPSSWAMQDIVVSIAGGASSRAFP